MSARRRRATTRPAAANAAARGALQLASIADSPAIEPRALDSLDDEPSDFNAVRKYKLGDVAGARRRAASLAIEIGVDRCSALGEPAVLVVERRRPRASARPARQRS